MQDVTTARPLAISPEGTGIIRHPVSPDGRFVVASGSDAKFWLYPVEQGEAHPIPGLETKESRVFGWSGDGRALYVAARNQGSAACLPAGSFHWAKAVMEEPCTFGSHWCYVFL